MTEPKRKSETLNVIWNNLAPQQSVQQQWTGTKTETDLQDPEVLEAREVHFGDSGDVVSVQIPAERQTQVTNMIGNDIEFHKQSELNTARRILKSCRIFIMKSKWTSVRNDGVCVCVCVGVSLWMCPWDRAWERPTAYEPTHTHTHTHTNTQINTNQSTQTLLPDRHQETSVHTLTLLHTHLALPPLWLLSTFSSEEEEKEKKREKEVGWNYFLFPSSEFKSLSCFLAVIQSVLTTGAQCMHTAMWTDCLSVCV